MVYLEQSSNTQIYGDVQTNKISFKEENVDFIMSILSSNLYSNPIGSLIREYVSNAEDSHREAGIDDPILVTLDKNDYDDNFFFSVQDFGVGISPDRFEDVFINLASSTKRESNTYIGMWGLGRLSGLSYSSQVNITSVYNGTKTYYLMYKDGNKIFIDNLGSEETEDRNGVTITIPVNKNDLNSFSKEIVKQLSFFEKVYVQECTNCLSYLDNELFDKYKAAKIKYYDTFAINTFYPNVDYSASFSSSFNRSNQRLKFLLGNVVYPIDFDLITLPKYIHKDENMFIRFAIGELEVTPNRENILYSKKNIETINRRLVEVQEEKLKVFKDVYDKEVNDMLSYNFYLNSDNTFLTVMENPDKRNQDIDLYFGDKITFRYHGVDYKETKELKELFKNTLFMFYDVDLFYQNQILEDEKISNLYRRRDNDFILNSIKNIIICDFQSLNTKAKRYFREKILPDSNYEYTVSKHDKKPWLKRMVRTLWDTDDRKSIHRVLLKLFMWEFLDKIKDIPTFDNDSVPSDYTLPKRVIDRDYNKENIQFNFIKLSKNDPTSTALSPYSCPSKDIHKLTIYASKDDDKRIRALCHFMYRQMKYNSRTRYSDNISFCTVAPGKIKYLQDNSNLISLEDFMKTDTPHLRALATVEYINREYTMLEKLFRITNLGVINPDLLNVQQQYNAFTWKYDFYKNYSRYNAPQKELLNEIYEVCKENNWFDDEMKDYFDKYSKLIKGAEILLIFLNNSATIPESMVNLIIDYVTTKNLFDVPEEMKEKLKEETVFNIKK